MVALALDLDLALALDLDLDLALAVLLFASTSGLGVDGKKLVARKIVGSGRWTVASLRAPSNGSKKDSRARPSNTPIN